MSFKYISYACLDDMFLRYGRTNTLDAANFDRIDLDEEETRRTVEYRVCAFLQKASAEIDAHLRGGTYEVNFSRPYDPIIVNLCCEIAYISLYTVRHSSDGTEVNPFALTLQEHKILYANIMGRRMRLNDDGEHTMDIPSVKKDGKIAKGNEGFEREVYRTGQEWTID
jgi:phage gp36-like protein